MSPILKRIAEADAVAVIAYVLNTLATRAINGAWPTPAEERKKEDDDVTEGDR